jgi:hypothetical protein
MTPVDKLVVGINYPWYSYGFDFGPPITNMAGSNAPPNRWDTPLPQKRPSKYLEGVNLATRLDAFLDICKGLGIQVVRWFILADGWNLSPVPTIEDGKWVCKLKASLAGKFITDFKNMLKSFQIMKMQVIPVLVDFQLFAPGKVSLGKDIYDKDRTVEVDTSKSVSSFVSNYFATSPDLASTQDQIVDYRLYIKGGRASFLKDGVKDFMTLIFEPLLNACEESKSQIYAWDICNEPDEGAKEFGLSVDDLANFLFQGVQRVVKHKMRATIGFKLQNSFASSYFPVVKVIGAQFLNARFGSSYLQQFHYWPEKCDGNDPPSKQPPVPPFLRSNVILGEFGTRFDDCTSGDWVTSWPKNIETRLAKLNELNFGCALLWAATLQDGTSNWDADAQNAVKKFVSP